jgi:hypothetical protein
MAAFHGRCTFLLVSIVVSATNAPSLECVADESSVRALLHEEDLGHISLLQTQALKSSHGSVKRKASKTKDPRPAGWFGDFSEGESTYAYDGTLANRNVDPEVNVKDGWNPTQSWNPDGAKAVFRDKVESAEWFYDSESGGYKEAWQTSYPAMPESVPGNRVPTGRWFTGTGEDWQEDYRSPSKTSSNNVVRGLQEPASWFDDSVNQIDGFGRLKFPGFGSNRRYLYWEEKRVNASLTCKDPGCTAQVSLLAPFDSSKEIYKNCKLSVKFHPTDFDDQYSGEQIEWVQVNERQLQSGCHPMSHGCNYTMWRPLLDCVNDAPVDLLIPEDGELKISAKIPEVVDECPYNGNLLSGMAELVCLVSPKVPPPQPPLPVAATSEKCQHRMPLQCSTRGCAAQVAIPISCGNIKANTCHLSLIVNQTDYDNLDGTPELIEYVKVDGKQVASNLKPGLNPCDARWHGDRYNASDLRFTVLKDYDVSETVRQTGLVQIEGKISQYVDECASNGYLFDAMAEVTCHEKL